MTNSPIPVKCGVAQAVHPGQDEPGDGYLVEPFPQGVLISVIDGLGHGPKAADAAHAALDALKPHAQDEPLSLMQRCHQALTRTRGAVLSIASLNATHNMLNWVGVGNVTAVLIRNDPATEVNREYLHLRGGIVGYRLPHLRAFEVKINVGDTLIFVTDGIRSSFMESFSPELSPQETADHILNQHNRGTDDALVLVARYVGMNGAFNGEARRTIFDNNPDVNRLPF